MRSFVTANVDFFSAEKKDNYVHSLPELIDFNAVHNPDHNLCIQTRSTEPSINVTNAQFKVAIDQCAQWISENVKLPPVTPKNGLTDKHPVALLMESDFGLLVHQFALVSMGIPPLVLSARLSPEAIFHLLKSTEASSLIISPRIAQATKGAFGGVKLIEIHVGQPYNLFLNPPEDKLVKRQPTYPDNVDANILLLHSSGTTGLPKPIALTHRQLVFSVSHGDFDTEEEAQGIVISTLPLFHGFGLLAPGLAMSIGKTVCFPASDRIPDAQSIVDLVNTSGATGMMTVPFLLEDMAGLPNGVGLKALAKLDFVGTGGSALSAAFGASAAAAGIKLLNLYGTTETGPLTKTFAPKDGYDWKYFRLRKDVPLKITELEPVNGEKRFRLTVFPFGADKPFEIADQLIRNEKFPETDFAAVGRDDDVVVLATGEKVNPLLLETALTESGLVKSAIAFGENQFEIGVIVEPTTAIADDQKEDFKKKIWPIIVQAGERMDATARIYSTAAVIVVSPTVVIPRTDKGSIARKEAFKLLEAEITQVYKDLENGAIDEAPLNYANLEQELKELIQKRLKLRVKADAWTVDDNLFYLGLDSLQATTLRRILLSAAAETSNNVIGKDFIYVNPSVQAIADALRQNNSSSTNDRSLAKEVESYAQQYSVKGINVSETDNAGPKLVQGAVVLLTGSSGGLGSHALAQLAKSPEVAKVVCLLRKRPGTVISPIPGAVKVDRSALLSKGIELADEEWAKVTALEIDPSAINLGLPPMVYGMVSKTVTHVLHAAWPMNFHMRLPSFAYQFSFLKNLLQLAVEAPQKVRFQFISSISALALLGLVNPGQSIPEAPLDVESAACGVGYADAKLACEKILEEAASLYSSTLEVSIVRCGQLAGSRKTGAWNVMEQIPMLIRTSQGLGILPTIEGTVSWIPVDDAALAVTEILLNPDSPALVAHVENPVRQPWTQVLDFIGTELGIRQFLPFDDWLDKVAATDEKDADIYPVKKLYEFFNVYFRVASSGAVIMATDVSRKSSATLRALTALDKDVIKGYVKYWRSAGYLS
ncbi:acetyl-CoA synthetase-like protein [Trichoderma velutinum]